MNKAFLKFQIYDKIEDTIFISVADVLHVGWPINCDGEDMILVSEDLFDTNGNVIEL